MLCTLFLVRLSDYRAIRAAALRKHKEQSTKNKVPMPSEPEIARRCPSCGVSIRVRGLFCRQCGKPVPQQKSDSVDNSAETYDPSSYVATMPLDSSSSAAKELTNFHPAPNQAETIPLEPPKTDQEISGGVTTAAAAAPTRRLPQQPAAGARTAVVRARAAREAIEEDVLQGVGKLREISTVVLDEASYDPSLRFVLVAAVLFVLFIIILILSEVIA